MKQFAIRERLKLSVKEIRGVPCTGCSLLCDDWKATLGEKIEIYGLCSHGFSRLEFSLAAQVKPSVNGKEVEPEEAIRAACDVLGKLKRPLIYGADTCSNEAVRLAVELAKKFNGVFETPPSVCKIVVPLVWKTSLGRASLEDVLEAADMIIYWGASPADTHLRHASRFSIFPRGKLAKHGRESRILTLFDVRKNRAAKVAHYYFSIQPGRDQEVAARLAAALERRGGEEFRQLVKDIEASSFVAIFVGTSVLFSLNSAKAAESIVTLARRIAEDRQCVVIPMAERVNCRGAAEYLLEAQGSTGPIDFSDGAATSAVGSLFTGTVDGTVVINVDPTTVLPRAAWSMMIKRPLIVLTEAPTVVDRFARAVIPISPLGLRSRGTVVRMDGYEVKAEAALGESGLGDNSAILRLLEAV